LLSTVNLASFKLPDYGRLPAHILISPLFTEDGKDECYIELPEVIPATMLLLSVIITSLLDNSSIYALLDIS